jgi:hypothetical protein
MGFGVKPMEKLGIGRKWPQLGQILQCFFLLSAVWFPLRVPVFCILYYTEKIWSQYCALCDRTYQHGQLSKKPENSCSQIHSQILGDKFDYGISLLYRPASLCSLTGRYDNPMP